MGNLIFVNSWGESPHLPLWVNFDDVADDEIEADEPLELEPVTVSPDLLEVFREYLKVER